MQGEFYKKNWRWFVLGTLFLATFLNYFNRQTLGTAIDPISKEFGLNNEMRGNLLAAFTLTYALTHFFIGIIVDRVRNLKLFFAFMVIGWSMSSLLVAFAPRRPELPP
ncbi:MFS transporter [bacterium]|nr:MFS transporter [bacterium]